MLRHLQTSNFVQQTWFFVEVWRTWLEVMESGRLIKMDMWDKLTFHQNFIASTTRKHQLGLVKGCHIQTEIATSPAFAEFLFDKCVWKWMQGVLTQSNLKLEHLPSSVKWRITMAPSDNQNVYHILWSLPRRDEHVARSEPWRRGTWAAAAAIKGRSKVIKVAWPGWDQKWQQRAQRIFPCSIWSWSWCRPLNHWRFLSKIKLLRLTPSWPVLDCETATSYQCCGHQWLPSFALDIAKCHGNRKNRKGRIDFLQKACWN